MYQPSDTPPGAFWRRIARSLENPDGSVPEVLEQLSRVRSMTRETLAMFAKTRSGRERSHLAHDFLWRENDQVLEWIARSRGVSSAAMWEASASRLRFIGVLSFDELAAAVRSSGDQLRFRDLPPRQRVQVMRALAGHTPLGAAWMREESFRRRVARCFDDPSVQEARVISGPINATEQVLALYTDSSVSSVRRRRREHRSK